MVKLDSIVIKPLIEALGQNLETVNATNLSLLKPYDSPADGETQILAENTEKTSTKSSKVDTFEDFTTVNIGNSDPTLASRRQLSLINKDSGLEVGEEMGTIIARDVEQGKCAAFRKTVIINDKRSVTEPRFIPVSILHMR